MVDQVRFVGPEMCCVENGRGMGEVLPPRDTRDGSFCNGLAVNQMQHVGKGLLGLVLFSEVEQSHGPF